MKLIKFLAIPILLLSFLAFQNCGSSSGDGGGSSNPNAISCNETGAVGTWLGTVAGNSDTLNILSNCVLSSSYCQSFSNIAISTVNVGCPSGASSCGQGIIRTTSANGNANCFAPGSAATCSFAVYNNGSTLLYTCGGSVYTYSRQ